MRSATLPLLCNPRISEALQLISTPGKAGVAQQELAGIRSGERFRLRGGIPLLVSASSITGSNRQFQRFYDRWAWLYDPFIRVLALLGGKREEQFRREYLRELEIHPDDRVLEVATGTGGNLRYLPKHAHYYGLDLAWGMVRQCRRNLQQWKRDAELLVGDAEHLPFQDALFDVVYQVGGINTFNDRARAIREMIRVAKPGTKIVIVDETDKVFQTLAWVPGIQRIRRQYGQRLAAPVALVPAEMTDVQTKLIAKGYMYCLSFRTPGSSTAAAGGVSSRARAEMR